MSNAKIKTDGTPKENPWDDPELLEKKYVYDRMSTVKLAEEWGCAANTVRDRLKKFNIPIRSRSAAVSAGYGNHPMEVPMHVKSTGAVRWNYSYEDEKRTVFVHRLLAVAEWGFDAVRDSVVHHENEIRWDNRPANLVLMDHDEHSSHHKKVGDEDRERIVEMYAGGESTYDLSEKFDVTPSTISAIVKEFDPDMIRTPSEAARNRFEGEP